MGIYEQVCERSESAAGKRDCFGYEWGTRSPMANRQGSLSYPKQSLFLLPVIPRILLHAVLDNFEVEMNAGHAVYAAGSAHFADNLAL